MPDGVGCIADFIVGHDAFGPMQQATAALKFRIALPALTTLI